MQSLSQRLRQIRTPWRYRLGFCVRERGGHAVGICRSLTLAIGALILAVLFTSCGSQPGGDYDAAATAECLKNRPEYVPGPLPKAFVQDLKVTRLELMLFGPKINR